MAQFLQTPREALQDDILAIDRRARGIDTAGGRPQHRFQDFPQDLAGVRNPFELGSRSRTSSNFSRSVSVHGIGALTFCESRSQRPHPRQ